MNLGAWFEIPVTDMDRAVRFYQTVFGVQLRLQDMGGLQMAWFPMSQEGGGASGSLCKHAEYYKPSTEGTLIYLASPEGDIQHQLDRIPAAGGQVIQPKTEIGGGFGYMAQFLDTEGNRVALHSNQ